jgi:hypothetical protein
MLVGRLDEFIGGVQSIENGDTFTTGTQMVLDLFRFVVVAFAEREAPQAMQVRTWGLMVHGKALESASKRRAEGRRLP